MNKTVNTIGRIAQIVAVPVLISSFFVEDNKKAVNLRWLALGLYVGGTGARFLTTKSDPLYKPSAKKTEWEVMVYEKSGKLRNDPIFQEKKSAEDFMAEMKKIGYKASMAPIYTK